MSSSHSNNHSWNHGVEGPTDDPKIKALRERQKRNLMATLILSHGTLLLLGGDELGNSQQGNNNAYAQDNEIAWLNWDKISPDDQVMLRFTKKLLQIRKTYPVLNRGRFLTGYYNESLKVKDVTWLTSDATEMTESHWQDINAKAFGMLLDGRAQATGIKRHGEDATLLIVFNSYHDIVNFKLPAVKNGKHWVGFRTMLRYKCDRAGVGFEEVNEAFSTQDCSACTARSGPKGLKDRGVREWTCTECGARHQRDVNAARNILRRGRATLAVGIPVL